MGYAVALETLENLMKILKTVEISATSNAVLVSQASRTGSLKRSWFYAFISGRSKSVIRIRFSYV